MPTRANVFETNSSSTHCITLGSGQTLVPLIPSTDGILIIKRAHYENSRDCSDIIEKIRYVLEYIESCGFYEENKLLHKVLKEYSGAKEVAIIMDPEWFPMWDSEDDTHVGDLFKDSTGETLKIFLFDSTSFFDHHDRDYACESDMCHGYRRGY